jgi:hypothetical protein
MFNIKADYERRVRVNCCKRQKEKLDGWGLTYLPQLLKYQAAPQPLRSLVTQLEIKA